MNGSMFGGGTGLKGALRKEIEDIDHRLRRDRESVAATASRIKTDEESRKLAVQFLEKLGEKVPEDAGVKSIPKEKGAPRRKTGYILLNFLLDNPGRSFSIPQILEGIGWVNSDANAKAIYSAIHVTLKPNGRVGIDALGLYKALK